ncbi:MAG: DUF5320 domain-containing protein [Acetomicrobium sp.]|nr:DUF5320 domain-containing protein [Acetomicrobium sp.]
MIININIKGGLGMPRGFGRGGCGFGFRGRSPAWPYVGMGRGGLPRCWYFLGGAAGAPYEGYIPRPWWGYAQGASNPQTMSKEQEIELLKAQADAVKAQLDAIEARVRELEGK